MVKAPREENFTDKKVNLPGVRQFLRVMAFTLCRKYCVMAFLWGSILDVKALPMPGGAAEPRN